MALPWNSIESFHDFISAWLWPWYSICYMTFDFCMPPAKFNIGIGTDTNEYIPIKVYLLFVSQRVGSCSRVGHCMQYTSWYIPRSLLVSLILWLWNQFLWTQMMHLPIFVEVASPTLVILVVRYQTPVKVKKARIMSIIPGAYCSKW